jgi:CubicO group peptidase (beta-lactamase class C family)
MTALDLLTDWPVPHAAGAVLVDGEVVASAGDADHEFRLASLAKPISAWATLVAVEQGLISLDTPVGQPGCTLRHLLSHAGGYPFEGTEPIAAPERTRIYSNTGIEMATSEVAARAEMPFADYLRLGVLEPTAMDRTELRGSPAHGVWSTIADTSRFLAEVARPKLISDATAQEAVRPQYAGLGGIVPGVGRFERSPWGLGFEIRGDKAPHWTGTDNTPATFGHFGGAGTMMWIDPDIRPNGTLGLVALTDRPFDEWADDAMASWRELSDAVIADHGGVRA